MEDDIKTIGLSELLAEVDRDLDEFRRKHPGDYSVKNVTLWWDLEKERLMVRHGTLAAVKRFRKVQSFKRLMIWFFSGWVTMLVLNTVAGLMFR